MYKGAFSKIEVTDFFLLFFKLHIINCYTSLQLLDCHFVASGTKGWSRQKAREPWTCRQETFVCC